MPQTPHIRPVSALRNNFGDISRLVHISSEPVYLTKHGKGDMVVMSMEAYEQDLFERDTYLSLQAALQQAETTKKRYDKTTVLKKMQAVINARK